MTQEELKILELQCPSTRRCLERPPELDLEWLNRPIPKEAQVVDEDGNVFINARALTYEETRMEEGIRRKRGSWIATRRGEGDAKAVSEERKQKGIAAFMQTNIGAVKQTVTAIKIKFSDLMAELIRK